MNAINVIPSSSGNGFTMNLRNGSINVDDKTGMYVISTGCGAGKSTSIKELIKLKADKGIMYCVDTIAEADKMYHWITDNNILPDSDVLLIHGEIEARENMKVYCETPELIMNKKVIILTHVRFWTDLIDYFLIYKPTSKVPAFDGDFTKLMARKDLRAYVIFDETPMFYKAFASISRTVLGCFSEKVSGEWKCKGKADLEESYKEFIAGGEDDFCNTTHKLGRIKRDVVLECIPRYWEGWKQSGEQKMNISFYPKNLWQSTINTHILIYEGAGDILLHDSSCFTLLDIPYKYNAKVNFHEITAPQERRNEFDPIKFNETVNNIIGILKTRLQSKILIVVWKDIGKRFEDEPSGESDWVNKIDEELKLRGYAPDMDYSITYFGSSKTKSTNEFRNHTGIILLGDWNIPYTFANSVEEAFLSETTLEDYRMWYYTQLLSRIGIRNFDGGEYDVWYSSDYNPEFINCISTYLNNNIYNPIEKAKHEPDWLAEKAGTFRIRKEIVTDIQKLAEHDTSLKDYIMANRKEVFTISLDQLYIICPKSEKKKSKYDNLKNNLKKLDITLIIS